MYIGSPVSNRIQGRSVPGSWKGRRSRCYSGKILRHCFSSHLCGSASFFCLSQTTVAAFLALMDQKTIPQLHSGPRPAPWRESPSLLVPIPSSHGRDSEQHNLRLVPTPSPKNCDQVGNQQATPMGWTDHPMALHSCVSPMNLTGHYQRYLYLYSVLILEPIEDPAFFIVSE